MISLELPHITVLSKCDLVQDKKVQKKYLKLEYSKKYVDADDVRHIHAFNRAGGNVDEMDMDSIHKEDNEKDQTELLSHFSNKYSRLTQKIKELVNIYKKLFFKSLFIKN